MVALWFTGQAFWLSIAYIHEMVGPPYWGRKLWLALWTASCVFLVINLVILKSLMRWIESGQPVSGKRDDDQKTSTKIAFISHAKREGRNEENDVRKRNTVL